MSRQRLVVITVGLLLTLFLASMESTVVATAMPTIVSKLGGISVYSWAFAAYMITSTTATPIYGKLSDTLGRRSVYAAAVVIFLIGSLLCGVAASMEQLILFRAVQGVGAGGLLALAFIIVGDLFTFQQRARMQGVFSGVWGVSSVVGPLLGGFLVDRVGWQWVFFVNLLPGLLAGAIVVLAWRDTARTTARPPIDFAGAALLVAASAALLLGLEAFSRPEGWLLVGLAVVLCAALIAVERRAADPILPLGLFRDRLFLAATGHGVFAGWAMFGSLSFVPLFVQAVLGTSATVAGTTLTPMMMSWVVGSVISSRLLISTSYRNLAVVGSGALAAGSFLLSQVSAGSSQAFVMLCTGLMGIGMGFSIPAFVIAVQTSVRRAQLGTATATVQFSRSIGGALGVSVMGAVLTNRLAALLVASGRDPSPEALTSLLDASGGGLAQADTVLKTALGGAVQSVFVAGFVAAALALAVTLLAPHWRIGASKEPERAGPEMAPKPAGDIPA